MECDSIPTCKWHYLMLMNAIQDLQRIVHSCCTLGDIISKPPDLLLAFTNKLLEKMKVNYLANFL